MNRQTINLLQFNSGNMIFTSPDFHNPVSKLYPLRIQIMLESPFTPCAIIIIHLRLQLHLIRENTNNAME